MTMQAESSPTYSWAAAAAPAEAFVSAVPSWLAPKMDATHNRTSENPIEESLPAIEISLAESALRPPPTPMIVEPEMQVIAMPEYPDLREENAALKRELVETAQMIARMRRELLDASEAELVRLACAIAEKVVARELTADPSLLVTWAKEGIAALDSADGVVVALASDFAETVAAEEWNAAGEPLRVELDAKLPLSKCEVRTRAASVDVSAAARLSAVTRELGVGE